MAEQLSGLAGEVRSSISSDQFDLSGYTESRARDLMLAAFSTPLPAPKEMVRFTFVVGGGKLVRSKYSDDLPKWLAAAAREIGFTEDRGAAETFTSQVEKFQGYIASKSPVVVISSCTVEKLQGYIASKISSWRQARKMLEALKANQERYKEIEAKLCSGTVLTVQEQLAYDNNSGGDDEKMEILQGEVKKYVEEASVASLEATINIAAEQKEAGVLARKAVAEKANATKHRLKYGDDVRKLRVNLLQLLTLSVKPDVEHDIEHLENLSRGWFETDEDFQARCDCEVKEAANLYAAKMKKSSGKGGGGSWVSVQYIPCLVSR
eukprot:gene840-33571_t